MKKYIAVIVLLSFFMVGTMGFVGSSSILQKIITTEKACSITVNIDGTLQTFNNCLIVDQDGVMVKFDYPSNGITYIYLMSDVKQIRYPTQ